VRLLKLCPKLLRSLLQFLPVVAPRFFLSVNDQAKAVLIPCPANDDRSLRRPALIVECRGVVDLGRDPGFKVPCEGKGCFFEEGVGCSFVIVNRYYSQPPPKLSEISSHAALLLLPQLISSCVGGSCFADWILI
jgi:hypothetical protein